MPHVRSSLFSVSSIPMGTDSWGLLGINKSSCMDWCSSSLRVSCFFVIWSEIRFASSKMPEASLPSFFSFPISWDNWFLRWRWSSTTRSTSLFSLSILRNVSSISVFSRLFLSASITLSVFSLTNFISSIIYIYFGFILKILNPQMHLI